MSGELFKALVFVAMVGLAIAAIALTSVWWMPSWVAFRIGMPLSIVALVLGQVGLNKCKRALAEMRLLIIEYHGIDPGGP